MTITDNHSLSPKWLTSREASLNIRWPFFQPKTLDNMSKLGRRLAKRRGLTFRASIGGWMRISKADKLPEFMKTFSGNSVSDHDLPQFTVDLLWTIFEQADEDGNLTLTPEQKHDIRGVLVMVGILEDGCSACKGRGWFTQQDLRADGKNHDWIIHNCPFCGGHGRKVYKRDVRQPVKESGE